MTRIGREEQMVQNHPERPEGEWMRHAVRSLCCGGAGLLTVLILLLSAAILSERMPFILTQKGMISKFCLFAGSFVCGAAAVQHAAHRRLLYALAGEAGLLMLLLPLFIAHVRDVRPLACAAALGIMFFGAFAGALLRSRPRRQRRGKR